MYVLPRQKRIVEQGADSEESAGAGRGGFYKQIVCERLEFRMRVINNGPFTWQDTQQSNI